MKLRTKHDKAYTKFSQMRDGNPRQFNAARKLLQGILLTIADEMLNEEEVQIQIGDKIYPSGESNLYCDDEFIDAIMNAKKGTPIMLLRFGDQMTDSEWEVTKQSICKK